MPAPNDLASQLRLRYPMLQYFTDRTFGVEIEFYGLDYVITPVDGGIIKPYNISSKTSDGQYFQELFLDHGVTLSSDRNSWHLEEDASICHRGGAELVSPVLRGMEGLIQAYYVFHCLCEFKRVEIDSSCGFHVHHGVDRNEYTCKQIKQLVRIVHPLEEVIYLLIPGERQNNRTCRPMEIDVEAFLELCECENETEECQIKTLWYSAENRYDPEAAKHQRYDKTRYHGLNLHSYWYRSTIEFRYHSAILHNPDEAMQWIIFTQFLIELSFGHIPPVHLYPNANKWMQLIYKIYHASGYGDRIKQLSA